MSSYAKHLKDILQGRLTNFGIVCLNEECSAMVPRKFPTKMKDSSKFTIPYLIGEVLL